MTDDRAKLPDVELTGLGSAGDKLAPRVVKAEGSHGGTTGDGESAGVAEVNVEEFATERERAIWDLCDYIVAECERLKDMDSVDRKRDLP